MRPFSNRQGGGVAHVHRGWARSLPGVLLGLVLAGCVPPYNNVVTTPDGQPIRLETITEIVNNPDLTEDQKRQQLLDLGLSAALTDLLVREL